MVKLLSGIDAPLLSSISKWGLIEEAVVVVLAFAYSTASPYPAAWALEALCDRMIRAEAVIKTTLNARAKTMRICLFVLNQWGSLDSMALAVLSARSTL